MKKLIVLLLCLSFMVQLAGCAWPSGGANGKGVTGTLSPENSRVGSASLALDMGTHPLDEEARCTIKSAAAPVAMEGVDIQAYEFSIDTDEELLSVMELTLPYDEKELDGLSPEGNVGAAYYNEETAEWEPVSFKLNDNGTLTIYTEHLSTYGCFVTKDDFTRDAYVSYVIPEFAYTSNYSIDADSIITDTVNNGGNPSDSAVKTGLEVLDLALSLGSAGVDTVSYELNALTGVTKGVSGNSLMNGISDRLGTLGVAVSVAQVAMGMYDIYNGNTKAIFPCYRDSLKGSVAYVGGKAGSKLFSLAFLGVLAIDYSINKFGETAWAGRTDIYRKAYALYYEEEGGKPTAREWAKLFLNARETAKSPERYQLRIEGLVNRYVNKFWANDTVVAYYQSEVSKGSGFTGGGGLSESMKAEISREYANELYRGVLQDAFKLIADRDVRIANQNVLKELNAIKRELNKACTIELYDGTLSDDKKKSDMADATVFVTLPDAVADADSWSTALNSEGSGQIQFTLLAYLMAGMPSELCLYAKGTSKNDEPTARIPFTVENFTQRVDIGVEALPLSEILGSYEGDLTINTLVLSEAGYQQYLNTLDADDKRPSKAECDEMITAILAENPLSVQSLSISSDAPESGECVIQVNVINSKGDSYPATSKARYENDFLITDGEKGEGRIAVTKEADGTIRIAGSDVPLGISENPSSAVAYYAIISMNVVKVD